MKPSAVYAMKLSAAGVLAGAGLLSAGAAALTLSGGTLIDLAPRHETRAEAALSLAPPDLALGEAQSRAALAQAPMTASAWARLAYVDYVRADALTPAAQDYLERSYAVAPFGPDITPWRVRFLFENWGALTPSLREQAMTELRVLARYRGGVARNVAGSIQHPAGRLAAQMVRALGQGDAVRDREAREAEEAV